METVWPVAVLLFLLLYSYARFFQAPYIGFQFIGTTGRVSEIFIDQRQSPNLEKGDMLVSFNGHTFKQFQEDLGLEWSSGIGAGQQIQLTVTSGGDKTKEIAWTIPGFTTAEFLNRLLNTWFLSYVFWLAGTLSLLLIRPKDQKWNALIAFYFITAIWLMAGSLSITHLWASSYVLRVAIWMSLPIYVQLHWNFPRPLSPSKPRRWQIFYGLTALFATLQVIGFLPSGFYVIPFAAAFGISAILLIWRFIFRRDERREIGLLFLALLIALVPAVIIAVLSAEKNISAVAPGYLFSLLTLPGAYFYVVYRRQLGGSELRANRLISLYLFLILLLLLFVSILPLFAGQLHNPQGIGATILLTGVAAALFSIFGFTHFQKFVEHRLLRIQEAPEELLRSFANRISTSFTQEHLVEVLTKEVLPSLLIRESALVDFSNDVPSPIYRQGLDEKQVPSGTELKHQAFHQEREELRGSERLSWLRLTLPLHRGKDVVGFWLLGRKDPDDYYSYPERNLLAALADQMAIALVNIHQAQSLLALYKVDIDRQEQERTHLARELHDDILRRINELTTGIGERAEAKEFTQKNQELNDGIRSLIQGMRPPMLEYGLYHAVNGLIDDLADRWQRIDFQLDLPVSEVRFEPQVEVYIYRILQQACENAIQHAKPSSVSISGVVEAALIDLTVADDGVGFELNASDLGELLDAHHFGLAGMKERAELIGAHLEIKSAKASGTRLHLVWKPDVKKTDI